MTPFIWYDHKLVVVLNIVLTIQTAKTHQTEVLAPKQQEQL